MQAKIHPPYALTTITCACGEVVHIRSTKSNIRVEICSKCHPFFTGQQRLVDTAGRVERFQKKYRNRQPAGTKRAMALKTRATTAAKARTQTKAAARAKVKAKAKA